MAVYEQPGRTESVDKSGKKTLTITYVGDGIATPPTISNASLASRTVVSAEAGTVRTTYQYDLTSAGTVTSLSGIVGIEFAGSLRTVPIEAHPNFAEPNLYPADIKKVKDAVQIPDRTPSFADTTDEARAVSLYGYLVSGIESYYVPSIIVRKTYYSPTIPSGNKLGKIADPGVYYAAKPSNATWLLINLSARGEANNYTITEEYELSGEGGWDTYLYQ